ncbi:hypothetical protein Cha6605_0616 [Chamaesiphon minutus PCC 6605]|uniref:Uncharacterized protein n=1 Tax=Chamaesiphon minutus (strain ATCC 27169 / PCC 6605) TaxID=1173020 RepID=K9UB96_CHAP6|nr:hypothetical protein Cha6605_0616 [Chamaesiphon minutus PCC 6605]
MFEHEIDLAYAVMDTITARPQLAGQTVERFKFCNSLVP